MVWQRVKSRYHRHYGQAVGQAQQGTGLPRSVGNSAHGIFGGTARKELATGTETPLLHGHTKCGEPQRLETCDNLRKCPEHDVEPSSSSPAIVACSNTDCSPAPKAVVRAVEPLPSSPHSGGETQPMSVDQALDRIEECEIPDPGLRLAALCALLRCRRKGIGGNISAYCSCPACCAERWNDEDTPEAGCTLDTTSESQGDNPEVSFLAT